MSVRTHVAMAELGALTNRQRFAERGHEDDDSGKRWNESGDESMPISSSRGQPEPTGASDLGVWDQLGPVAPQRIGFGGLSGSSPNESLPN
jgi:hypothetical protein